MQARQSFIWLSFNFAKKGCDFIRSFRSFTPILRHYGYALTLTVGTTIFGWLLIHNVSNVVERVVLFPPGTSDVLGATMMALGLAKIFTVFKRDSKFKKYVLMAITLCWLTISWAYVVNRTQNTGSVMAVMITVICYLELWRGDFSA